MQPIEINKLIKEIEKIERLKMKEGKALNVVFPQQGLWITADRNRLMQVLFNLLSNAIKNTKKGCITIGITKEGDWVKLYATIYRLSSNPEIRSKIACWLFFETVLSIQLFDDKCVIEIIITL